MELNTARNKSKEHGFREPDKFYVLEAECVGSCERECYVLFKEAYCDHPHLEHLSMFSSPWVCTSLLDHVFNIYGFWRSNLLVGLDSHQIPIFLTMSNLNDDHERLTILFSYSYYLYIGSRLQQVFDWGRKVIGIASRKYYTFLVRRLSNLKN